MASPKELMGRGLKMCRIRSSVRCDVSGNLGRLETGGLILTCMKCFVLFKVLSLIRFHLVLTVPHADM